MISELLGIGWWFGGCSGMVWWRKSLRHVMKVQCGSEERCVERGLECVIDDEER